MKVKIENIELLLGETPFRYNTVVSDGITGVFGVSGSGKTTLMNIISGIETPKKGRLTFNDRVLFDKQKNINIPINKRNIGVVFQENNLFPHLSVKKNLLYGKPYAKQKKQLVDLKTITDLLEIDRLLDMKPMQLSGGERQRVAIGRTLLSQPELLLMDEPFSNLDRKRRKQIISYLLKINNQFGIPILVISHDLEDILKLTNSLLIIDDGKVKASGNYLDIADLGAAKEIISHKRYINVFDLYHQVYSCDEGLNSFGTSKVAVDPLLVTNSSLFVNPDMCGRKVRMCIYPDDIALSKEKLQATSIQNQLMGTIKKIRNIDNSFYVSIDCGIELVAEVTKAAIETMNIAVGTTIYCLVKAKAIEIVHVFAKKQKTQFNNN